VRGAQACISWASTATPSKEYFVLSTETFSRPQLMRPLRSTRTP
jgi:hypothetical protein